MQEIKNRLSIVDVVSGYVDLRKAGKNFKGKSPFSNEKTPSFYVSPDRGMYYCFSTSQGGDIFTFIQVLEGVDFKGALKILAEKAGVELKPESPEKRSARDRGFHILELATEFYNERLKSSLPAQEYLQKRGLQMSTVEKWKIGFAPGPPTYGWRELKKYLNKKNIDDQHLFEVGLIKGTAGNKEPIDVFRDRIMFPLFDSSGRSVGFSGRILHLNEKAPKYVNSPETDFYKKSELLYGYHQAKSGIRQLGFSLIVEGQFDVVMCHQAGYNNTVAVSGTALTIHHVQLLERLSKQVVLALDADRAGIAAAEKASELMLKRGFDVKIAPLPDGLDPADLIKQNKAEFKKIIADSKPVIEFLLRDLLANKYDTRTLRLKAREKVLPYILLLGNKIDEEYFLRIFTELTDITMEAARFELEKMRDLQENTDKYDVNSNGSDNHNVTNKTASKVINFSGDAIKNSYGFLRSAQSFLDEKWNKFITDELNKIKKIDDFFESIKEGEISKMTFILEEQLFKRDKKNIEIMTLDNLQRLKNGVIKKCLSELRKRLDGLNVEVDEEEFKEILKKIQNLELKLKETYKQPDFL